MTGVKSWILEALSPSEKRDFTADTSLSGGPTFQESKDSDFEDSYDQTNDRTPETIHVPQYIENDSKVHECTRD